MKKAKVISFVSARNGIVDMCKTFADDQITVYAAQATFFIITSSIPFIILLLSLAKYVIDIDWLVGLIEDQISGDIGTLLKNVLADVVNKTGISLVSITAITTLWTSSRGVNAVTRGICGAYGIKLNENFLFDIVRSLLYTICFILLVIGSLLAMVFADTLRHSFENVVPLLSIIFQVIDNCSKIVFTIVLTMFFAIMLNAVSKKGKRLAKDEYMSLTDKLPRGFIAQLPGAAFAALGWVLFSYLYSLYIKFFPRASYIYGSLTAIVLLMLWLYTCMIILMVGAEINKYLFRRWNFGKRSRERAEKKKQMLIEKRDEAIRKITSGRQASPNDKKAQKEKKSRAQ